MFKNIGELASLISVIIGSASDLCKAGRCQTKIIHETSEFDVQKKRAEPPRSGLVQYKLKLSSEYIQKPVLCLFLLTRPTVQICVGFFCYW